MRRKHRGGRRARCGGVRARAAGFGLTVKAVAVEVPLIPVDVVAIVPDIAEQGVEGMLIAPQVARDLAGGEAVAIVPGLLQTVLIAGDVGAQTVHLGVIALDVAIVVAEVLAVAVLVAVMPILRESCRAQNAEAGGQHGDCEFGKAHNGLPDPFRRLLTAGLPTV